LLKESSFNSQNFQRWLSQPSKVENCSFVVDPQEV